MRYVFECACGYQTEKFFKTLPSEAKQKSAICDECGGSMTRNLGLEGFYATGGQKASFEREMAFVTGTDESGRPIYKDVNGRTQEIRTGADIDSFCKANALGKPRMVDHYNPITGKYEKVEQRQRMVTDPTTGKIDEARSGAVIRDAEKLEPMGKIEGEYVPPSHSITGRPMENGVMKKVDPKKRPLGIIDPQTLKPVTMNDVWGK